MFGVHKRHQPLRPIAVHGAVAWMTSGCSTRMCASMARTEVITLGLSEFCKLGNASTAMPKSPRAWPSTLCVSLPPHRLRLG